MRLPLNEIFAAALLAIKDEVKGSMLALFLFLQTANLSQAVVMGRNDRPTVTIAEGPGTSLIPIRRVARKCGFSRTWVWGDSTPAAQLWVLASEARKTRVACLGRWKTAYGNVEVKWMLPSLK